MEVQNRQLLICLLLHAFFAVSSSASVCYPPVFVNSNSQVSVNCTTSSLYSTAVCQFFHRGSSDIQVSGITNTHREPEQGGSYRITCTFLANVQQLTNGYRYYLLVKVYPDGYLEEARAETINVTTPIYFERAVITAFTANGQPGDIEVAQLQTVDFYCTATGHPNSTMTLSYGNNVFHSNFINQLSYSLTMRCENMDTYTCEADNGGSAESSINVYVICALRLEDQSDYNKTFDSFLDSATKSISFNVVGYPGPRQYLLLMYNKTAAKEQSKNETVVNGTSVNGTAWTAVQLDQYEIDFPQSSTDISVYTVTIKFVDDKAIQATQYILVLGNGVSELHYPFSLGDSFTEDFPVLAVALGVTGGVVGLVLIGVGAYCVYRNFFMEE